MPALRHEVADTALGTFRFGVDPDGTLVSLELPGWRPRGDEHPCRAAWRRWLEQYLEGRSPAFPGPWRMPGGSPFFRSVYRKLAALPGGATVSYGELARRCGAPGASRAVGNAMARNPLPLVVPCHRVLASQGLGGYGGGLELKRLLLQREAAHSTPPAKRPATNSR